MVTQPFMPNNRLSGCDSRKWPDGGELKSMWASRARRELYLKARRNLDGSPFAAGTNGPEPLVPTLCISNEATQQMGPSCATMKPGGTRNELCNLKESRECTRPAADYRFPLGNRRPYRPLHMFRRSRHC